ncbi:MAG TPA: peptidylprolyl isomerase [Gemmatimonadales bacterium]|nr:peptidylprolyl isomerase [Gemmatimonadales bacterium]
MRRVSLVLGGTLVAGSLIGCNALRDAFSSRADVVARANDQTLSVDRMAGWAGANRDLPLDQQTLGRVAHAWVDYALFAEAVVDGKNLRDSATALASMWPLVSQIKWQRLHDRLTARDNLTAQQVDSVYRAGNIRVFQHILFEVPQNAADSVDKRKHRQAEALLPQARSAGPRFSQLAVRYSEDPSAKAAGGSLGLSTRGQFVPQFEDAAWKLPPGGVSPVIKTQFGYHIIRRPPLAEVRDSFRVELEQRVTREFDSVYVDSLEIKRKITPVDRAPEITRTALSDIDAARASGQVLVKYRGGSLRVRDLVRWLAALNPQLMQTLPTANDQQVDQFLKILTQRQLLLEQADSAGIKLTDDDWKQIREEHDSTIVTLTTILNLTPEVVRDSAGKTAADRSKFAADRATEYLDRVLKKRTRYFPVPVFLAERLRNQAQWDVDETGLRRAGERGEQLRGDSTQAPGPNMRPAPGPPPIDTARPQGGGRKGR